MKTAGSGGSEGSAGVRANAPARATATKATWATLRPLLLEVETETRCPPERRTNGASAPVAERPLRRNGRSHVPAPFLRPSTIPLTLRHEPYIDGGAHSHLRAEQITVFNGSLPLMKIYLGPKVGPKERQNKSECRVYRNHTSARMVL